MAPPSGPPALTAQFQARITAALASQLAPIYCLAVQRYQLVLALDPADARATAQLSAYGEQFVRSCGP